MLAINSMWAIVNFLLIVSLNVDYTRTDDTTSAPSVTTLFPSSSTTTVEPGDLIRI